eukprot:5428470-Amphidinium_carterae.1
MECKLESWKKVECKTKQLNIVLDGPQMSLLQANVALKCHRVPLNMRAALAPAPLSQTSATTLVVWSITLSQSSQHNIHNCDPSSLASCKPGRCFKVCALHGALGAYCDAVFEAF